MVFTKYSSEYLGYKKENEAGRPGQQIHEDYQGAEAAGSLIGPQSQENYKESRGDCRNRFIYGPHDPQKIRKQWNSFRAEAHQTQGGVQRK